MGVRPGSKSCIEMTNKFGSEKFHITRTSSLTFGNSLGHNLRSFPRIRDTQPAAEKGRRLITAESLPRPLCEQIPSADVARQSRRRREPLAPSSDHEASADAPAAVDAPHQSARSLDVHPSHIWQRDTNTVES